MQQLWINHPSVLFEWPSTAPANRANLSAQILLAVGGVASVVRRSLVPLLTALIASFAVYLILPHQRKHYNLSTSIMQQQQQQVVARGGQYPQWSVQSASYPNNPSVFDFGKNVRAALPSHPWRLDGNQQMLARMHNGVTMMPLDQAIAPLPDPTWMARQPVQSVPYMYWGLRDQGKMRLIR